MTSIKSTLVILLALFATITIDMSAQSKTSKKKVLIDVNHGQKFYNDPSDMSGADPQVVDRVKYMTGEIQKNASQFDREMGFLKTAITTESLANCDILFVHMPSTKFSADEVKAINQFVEKGGGLFMVMDADYWSTLEQVNANDIVKPYGIIYKGDNPDGQSDGGYSVAGTVATKQYKIPYHGARVVEGGTPFCFSNATKENPFGVYKEVKKGKVVAMGDGMVSLYMTEWKDVKNYQCSEFMHDAFAWLLK
jgi:hypothetical protein